MNTVNMQQVLKENHLLRIQLGQKQQELDQSLHELNSSNHKVALQEASSKNMKTISDLVVEIERLKNKLLLAHQKNTDKDKRIQELEDTLRTLYEEFSEPEPKKGFWKKAVDTVLFRNG